MIPRYHTHDLDLFSATTRMSTDEGFHFSETLALVLEGCWRKAAVPQEWNLSQEQFCGMLERSARQRFSGKLPKKKEMQDYLETLHLTDLALAAACSAGNEAAWDTFVAQYRPELYRAGRAIAGEERGRELADSLYAELFGLRESEGQRRPLFEYFHGRSKLSTWLRAVLAQRHVDELRRSSRTEPLEGAAEVALDQSTGKGLPSVESAGPDPEREKFLAILQAALTAVLANLVPRDRLRLAYYYVNGLTLAQIGKLLGEHEATVSRKLDRTRRNVRRSVEASLRQEKKLSEAQMLLCFEYARDEWPFDLSATLSARR